MKMLNFAKFQIDRWVLEKVLVSADGAPIKISALFYEVRDYENGTEQERENKEEV